MEDSIETAPTTPARPSFRDRRLWGHLALTAMMLAALAFSALSICQYRFGVNDQAQYLVQVIAADEPGTFGDDLYLRAFGSLGSAFWNVLGAVTNEADRPGVFLALSLVIAATNALLVMLIARSLLPVVGEHRATITLALAAPAIMLCVPKELNWFGLVAIGDVELTATFAVMPLVFASMLMFVRGRLWWSLVAALVAAPIQGQSAAYLLSAWWLASVMTTWPNPRWRAVLAVIGVLGAAGLAKVWTSSQLPEESTAEFFRIGRSLYPELINPLNASLRAWIGVVGLIGVGALAAWRARSASLGPPHACIPLAEPASSSLSHAWHRFTLWWMCSFAFPLAGIVLHAAGLEDPLLWKFMTGRALMLPQLAAIIAISVWCVLAMAAGTRRRWLAGFGALLTLSFVPIEHAPVALSFVLAIGFTACIVFTPMRPARSGRPPMQLAWIHAALGSTFALLMILTMGTVRFVGRPFPWLGSGEQTAWLKTQHWARMHTPEGTRFITPPYLSGWRVGSHRSTLGELKDGALLLYSGSPVLIWAEHMRSLGFAPDHSTYRWLESSGPVAPSPPTDARLLASTNKAWLPQARQHYAEALSTSTPRTQAFANTDLIVIERASDPGEGAMLGPIVWSNERFVVRGVLR